MSKLIEVINQSNLKPTTKSFIFSVLKGNVRETFEDMFGATDSGSNPDNKDQSDSTQKIRVSDTDTVAPPPSRPSSLPDTVETTTPENKERIVGQLRESVGQPAVDKETSSAPKLEPFKTPAEKERVLGDIYRQRALLSPNKEGYSRLMHEEELRTLFPETDFTDPKAVKELYESLGKQIQEIEQRPVQGGIGGLFARVGSFLNPTPRPGMPGRPYRSEEEAFSHITGEYLVDENAEKPDELAKRSPEEERRYQEEIDRLMNEEKEKEAYRKETAALYDSIEGQRRHAGDYLPLFNLSGQKVTSPLGLITGPKGVELPYNIDEILKKNPKVGFSFSVPSEKTLVVMEAGRIIREMQTYYFKAYRGQENTPEAKEFRKRLEDQKIALRLAENGSVRHSVPEKLQYKVRGY